jgi:Protein kinase domain
LAIATDRSIPNEFDVHPISLRFRDVPLEQRYLAEDAEASRGRVRLVWTIATLLWMACVVLDLQFHPHDPAALARVETIRLGIGAPAVAGVVAFSFVRPKLFERGWQLAAFVGGIVTMLSLIALGLVPVSAPFADRCLYTVLTGFIIMNIVFHTTLMLRFRWASTATWIGTGAFLVSFASFPTSYVLDAVFWLVLSNVVGMITSYNLEAYRRKVLHQRCLLDAERAKTERLLKREISHQVAARSRQLGEELAKRDGPADGVILAPGDRFDARYRVTQSLGAGGMGAVYEVERLTDEQRFALKIITGRVSGANAARFAREAEIGARLHHPNLVSIVDVGVSPAGSPFLVMELVQGGSLEDQRARFGDQLWATPILRQIALGLAELHANAVVHRDLKPANVLLVDAEHGPLAKICDFGISRFGAIDESADVDTEGATVNVGADNARPRDLTRTGAFLGTPLYMPPEAYFEPARGPSADLFSFGILAYEALSGRSPFSVSPVLLLHSKKPIPEPVPLDGVRKEIAELVLACLAIDPTKRPRAKDVAQAL